MENIHYSVWNGQTSTVLQVAANLHGHLSQPSNFQSALMCVLKKCRGNADVVYVTLLRVDTQVKYF